MSPPVIDRVVDGRYRVESLLARGGMACVYQATDLRLERPVALKVMHAELARDEQFVRRFRREALSAARLSHPHVVGVFDQGEDDDLVFLAMELVPGQTLREVIRDRAPLSVRAALEVIDPVLQALGAAHAAGLVHRDVKPENVLIDPEGRTKVADFGLARAVTTSTVSRTNDLTWGTAAYLSPEQVEHGTADARSDVYAAALLLYEVLTGVKAFPGSSPIQVAYQHVHGQVPLAADLVPTVPAAVDALIQRATATDPGSRPADARELRRGLLQAVAQLSEEELDAAPRPGRAPTGTSGDADATTRFDTTSPLATDRTRAVARVDTAGSEGHFARTEGNRPARAQRAAARATPPPRDPRPRRRVTGWVLGMLLLVTGAGGAAATWYYTAGPGVHSAMPEVVGLTEADARATLDAENLDVVVEPGYSEEVPAGQVVAASEPVGTELRHGTDVTLTVSQGPERYAVPALAGRTVEEAQELLAEANLELGDTGEDWDEDVPAGQILTVTPASGEQVRPGTSVDVVVSAGPEPIEVPRVVEQPEAEARATLEDADFTVEVEDERVFDDEVPAGSVAAQSPSSGTGHRGDTVTLTISRGPETVPVPEVIGMQWQEARQTLEDAGLGVVREDLAGGYFNTVRFQSIDPGESVPRGTEVVLTVL